LAVTAKPSRPRTAPSATTATEVTRSDSSRAPVRAPQANAIAERFVRTARAECLDWLLIVNRRHLERVLRILVDHYNGHRPHRSLNLAPPDPPARKLDLVRPSQVGVERRDRLGGTRPRIQPRGVKPSLRTPQAFSSRVGWSESEGISTCQSMMRGPGFGHGADVCGDGVQPGAELRACAKRRGSARCCGAARAREKDAQDVLRQIANLDRSAPST
jgi:Integrase core domain